MYHVAEVSLLVNSSFVLSCLLIVVGHTVTLLDTHGPSSLNRFQTFLVFDIRQYVIKKWSRENNWE